jgi:carboxylate-amine ligase
MGWREYRTSLLDENKMRAARFGTGARLIDFGKQAEVPYAELLEELLEFIDDVVDELGSRNETAYAREILRTGTGADRQLAAWARRGDLRDVVDLIMDETEIGTA